MATQSERYEFYKRRGETLRVTTCDCCNIDGYRDAWQWSKGEHHAIGIRAGELRDNYVLITQREAEKRVPNLFT